MKRIITLMMLAMTAASGCDKNVYELSITGRGDVIERKLRLYRTGDKDEKQQFPQEELARIRRAYPEDGLKTEGKVHTLAGRFKGKTPQDIGGAGSLTELKCRMGAVSVYLERFRGSDDVATGVQARLKAADRFTDILIGWVAHEFPKSKDLPKLRTFLDRELRQDLKNLAIYAWLVDSVGRLTVQAGKEGRGRVVSDDHSVRVRMLQYLFERGYLKPADVPGITVPDERLAEWLGDVLGRMLADKVKIADKAILEKITSFTAKGGEGKEPKTLKSLNDYVKTTPAYKKELAAWRAAAATQPVGKKPEQPKAEDVWQKPLGAVLEGTIDFSWGGADLKVSYSGEGSLVETNGQVPKKADKPVVWAGALDSPDGTRMPRLCYALYAKAEAGFQKRHFGKVILEGDDLRDYVFWRVKLSKDHARQWDQFVDTLRPDAASYGRLKDFCFRDRKPTTMPGTAPAVATRPAGGASLIGRGLAGSPTTRPR